MLISYIMKEKIEEVIKVGDKFKITFYPQNINADMEEHQLQSTTRFGLWTKIVCSVLTKNLDMDISNFLILKTKVLNVRLLITNVQLIFF